MTSPTRPSARPRARRLAAIAAVPATTAVLMLGTAGPASAHERWFADSAPGGDWGFFFRPLPLALAAVVVVVTVVWRRVAARLPRPELRVLQPIGRLTPYIPRLLAIHLGVSLLAFSVTGAFLTPALELHHVPGGTAAGLAEAAVGIWLITGVRLRAAAAGVALLGPAALLAAGPVAVLETAPLLGIALFLAVLPPSDATFGRVDPSPERLRTAVFLLKAFVALGLITLAFSEKFTNPELARNTLDAYPQLNILSSVGVAPDTFIVIAGTVELLFGLLVLSGALPQVAVLVAMVPFNATLLIFGTTETIGHLPVYGVFLTLLAYGSDPRTAAAVPWLPGRDDLGRGLAWAREATRSVGRRPAPAVTP